MNARSILLLALLSAMPVAVNGQIPVDPGFLPGPKAMETTFAKVDEFPGSRMTATIQLTRSAGWVGNLVEKQPMGNMRVVLAVLAALLLLAGTVVFLSKGSRKAGPCYFPEPSWQPRLGAPHAGGNQAVRDLGPTLP